VGFSLRVCEAVCDDVGLVVVLVQVEDDDGVPLRCDGGMRSSANLIFLRFSNFKVKKRRETRTVRVCLSFSSFEKKNSNSQTFETQNRVVVVVVGLCWFCVVIDRISAH